ncbi:hypothetical protein Tco_0768260, partial [Tanacetum coccineum]
GEKFLNPRWDPRSPLGTGMRMKNDSPTGMGTGMGMRLMNGDGDGNGAVFIDRKIQRSLGAVLAVPDISGGRLVDYAPVFVVKVVKDIEDGHVEEMEFEQDIEDEGEENEEDKCYMCDSRRHLSE